MTSRLWANKKPPENTPGGLSLVIVAVQAASFSARLTLEKPNRWAFSNSSSPSGCRPQTSFRLQSGLVRKFSGVELLDVFDQRQNSGHCSWLDLCQRQPRRIHLPQGCIHRVVQTADQVAVSIGANFNRAASS